MKEEEKKQYIEAIKVAAGSVQYKTLSVKKTIIDAVSNLYKYYENSKDKNYLEIATLHMQAYLEMGFLYDDGKAVFDAILEKLGTTREMRFPKKFYVAKSIKLNKFQVNSMIKKWPTSPKQLMKRDEVVNDIMLKVMNRKTGIYYYKCAVTSDEYELVVNDEETFFHDLKRGSFYTFL